MINHKATMQPVDVTPLLDGRDLVTQGLAAGETVVTDGQYGCRTVPGSGRERRCQFAAPQRANHHTGNPAMSPAEDKPGAVERGASGGISGPFIRHPVATAMLMIGLLLVGLIAYRQLPIASLPEINQPTIAVTASMPGADPETMASSVATPLERTLGEIPGLRQMTSASATGFTQITLQFSPSRTVDSAASDVQSAINAAAGDLPPTMPTPPTYNKVNPADAPVCSLRSPPRRCR